MNPIEFARNLFTLRMEHKMTAEDLAEALGVTPETVCEWECAKTSPSLDQMNRLAKVYGIPLDQVIRNPKPPREDLPEPPAPFVPAPAPEPVAAEPEDEALPAPEEPPMPGRKKERGRLAEAIVLLLLLGIITAATLLLVKPQWLPWWN